MPTLKKLLELHEQSRLPHAILISGEEGIGKYAFALAFSKALLCQSKIDNIRACENCSACLLMKAGTYPDFFDLGLEVDDEGKVAKEIKIDQVRRLCTKLTLTSGLAALKIAIINPAEKMNSNSANSLLKTLEEPTPNTLLMLVCSHPARLPITARSRCQNIALSTPAKSAVLAWLQSAYPAINSETLYALGNGAPRFALEAAESNLTDLRREFLDDIEQLAARTLDPLHIAQKWVKSEPDKILSWFVSCLQDIARLKATQNPQLLMNADFSIKIQNMLTSLDLQALLIYLDQVLKAKQLLTRSVNIELLFETLMLNWAELLNPITKRG